MMPATAVSGSASPGRSCPRGDDISYRGVYLEGEQGALGDLLARIDDLELFHGQEGVYERRLIAVMVNRTGVRPVAGGTAPIRAYQDLRRRLDREGVHADIAIDLSVAADLWSQCLAILRQLFLPPDIRHEELEALAAIESPTEEDVTALHQLIASPNHLRHFLARVRTPVWLDLLTGTGMLDPPDAQGGWPVLDAVDRLAGEHAEAVSAWLERMYDASSGDPDRVWFIARAALDVGPPALQLVLRGVREHPDSTAILALGVSAAQQADASGQLVESLADIMLNEVSWRDPELVEPLLQQYQQGVDRNNAERRLRLLCYKIRSVSEQNYARRWLEKHQTESIADPVAHFRDDRFTVLLAALIEVARNAQNFLATESLLAPLGELPATIGDRLRVWLLGNAVDVDPTTLVEEIARAIAQRNPNSDDLTLIDKATEQSSPSQYLDVWRDALGAAPRIEDVGRALAAGQPEEAWLRAFKWIALLPDEAAGAWARPFAVLSAAYGQPSRETLERRQEIDIGYGGSPISAEQLRSLTPEAAAREVSAWRPDPHERLVSALELARTLEDVIKDSPEEWAAAPILIATELRHPTYIHHYLQAVAAVVPATDVPVDEFLDLIALVRTHPWPAEPLGEDDFDFDTDWRGAEQAGVTLIKALADGDVGFGDRSDEAWAVLKSEVVRGGEQV